MTLPFKAIISDLDGTLLNAEHKIGDFTIQTLSELSQKGVDVYIATGRNLPDVQHIIRKVNVDSNFKWCSCEFSFWRMCLKSSLIRRACIQANEY